MNNINSRVLYLGEYLALNRKATNKLITKHNIPALLKDAIRHSIKTTCSRIGLLKNIDKDNIIAVYSPKGPPSTKKP